MKVVLAVFVLLDMLLLANTLENYTIVHIVNISDWNLTGNVDDRNNSPFGNCNARQMWKIYTTCHTPLIIGMQKKKPVISLIERELKCKVNLWRAAKRFQYLEHIEYPYSSFLNEKNVKELRETARLLEKPIYQIHPCSISKDKYVEELKKCNSKMQAMWKNDTVDPRICREFAKTKKCQKQLVDTKCNYTGEIKIFNDFLFGNYNPFCPGGVDITITSGATFCKPFGTIALTTILLLAILLGQQ